MPQPISANPIQGHLEIKEIKDDVIILKNGGFRAVLMASSLDFMLKSTMEQEAIVYRYQDFLNSLDFSVQIVVNARKFDISQYIDFLQKCQTEQTNELLKLQMIEYIDFVKGLTQIASIMSSSFYLAIPYEQSTLAPKGLLAKLLGQKTNQQTAEESKEKDFQEIKTNLWQRVNFVATGLRGLGVNAVPLKTDELIELFFKLYNPGAKEKLPTMADKE